MAQWMNYYNRFIFFPWKLDFFFKKKDWMDFFKGKSEKFEERPNHVALCNPLLIKYILMVL